MYMYRVRACVLKNCKGQLTEGGGFKHNFFKDKTGQILNGGIHVHEGAAYTSEYGKRISKHKYTYNLHTVIFPASAPVKLAYQGNRY